MAMKLNMDIMNIIISYFNEYDDFLTLMLTSQIFYEKLIHKIKAYQKINITTIRYTKDNPTYFINSDKELFAVCQNDVPLLLDNIYAINTFNICTLRICFGNDVCTTFTICLSKIRNYIVIRKYISYNLISIVRISKRLFLKHLRDFANFLQSIPEYVNNCAKSSGQELYSNCINSRDTKKI